VALHGQPGAQAGRKVQLAHDLLVRLQRLFVSCRLHIAADQVQIGIDDLHNITSYHLADPVNVCTAETITIFGI